MTSSTPSRALSTLLLPALLFSSCTLSNGGIPVAEAKELPRFASCAELETTLTSLMQSDRGRNEYMMDGMPVPAPMGGAQRSSTGIASPALLNAPQEAKSMDSAGGDYSRTNVQVAGVDEADTVKTDGTYIYTLTDNSIVVTRATPAERMEVVARIRLVDGAYASSFFVDSTRLIVLGNSSFSSPSPYQPRAYDSLQKQNIMPVPPVPTPEIYQHRSSSFLAIYDIRSLTRPTLERTIEIEGSLVASRMIGHVAYLVSTSAPTWMEPFDGANAVPRYRDSHGAPEGSIGAVADCADVRSTPPVSSATFLSTIALDVTTQGPATRQVVLGGGEHVYASEDSLYVTQTRWDQVHPFWREVLPSRSWESTQSTDLYAFGLDGTTITYRGTTSVPGSVLNQFSMDEHEGTIRIATTDADWREGGSSNVFLMDTQLAPLGQLRGLAPGEQIYSARFIGERAYLVTFRKVDPLFVLDLADARNPKVLGKLKIPGYSDYIHPYDATHLIGIGKDAVDAGSGQDFAWYQGVKLALFDVSDPSNPKELAKTVIGDRGTESPVLSDHHAFSFDRSRNLLVLPVSLAEVQEQAAPCRSDMPCAVPSWGGMPSYGTQTFQGAYVYNLTLAKGFDLRGRITHRDGSSSDYENDVTRALTIGDALYTVSSNHILAHTFRPDVTELGRVSLDGGPDATPTTTSPGGWVTE